MSVCIWYRFLQLQGTEIIIVKVQIQFNIISERSRDKTVLIIMIILSVAENSFELRDSFFYSEYLDIITCKPQPGQIFFTETFLCFNMYQSLNYNVTEGKINKSLRCTAFERSAKTLGHNNNFFVKPYCQK